MSELDALILQEHRRAELERLRAGFDGCGCSDCQNYYKTLDLEKYGARVIRVAGIVVIKAGQTGADLWEKYNPPDYWAQDGQVFVHYGKGYCVAPTGATVGIGPVDKNGKPIKEQPGELLEHPQSLVENQREVVAKLPAVVTDGDNNIHEQSEGVVLQHQKHPGGRPRKTGVVHRVTEWRRGKEKQGVLL